MDKKYIKITIIVTAAVAILLMFVYSNASSKKYEKMREFNSVVDEYETKFSKYAIDESEYSEILDKCKEVYKNEDEDLIDDCKNKLEEKLQTIKKTNLSKVKELYEALENMDYSRVEGDKNKTISKDIKNVQKLIQM